MVFAQSKSARETGFAIRGREKIAQEERLPTFHQETKIRKREKGEGMVCLSFTLFPLSGSHRKRLAGTSAPAIPGIVLCLKSSLHSHSPNSPGLPAFTGCRRKERGL